jgi:membrane-associated protease RseP (regulator of RpoE activity)
MRLRWHIVFFLCTVFTTLIAGVMFTYGPGATLAVLFHPRLLLDGLPFSASVMAILTAHEMGHYVLARRYGVAASLPYFLPSPLFLLDLAPATFGAIFNLGTFGAVIVTRSSYPNRRALMDIGAAGPIAGFLVAVPIMAYGITISQVIPTPDAPGLMMGEPLIFQFLSYCIFGSLADNLTINLHPIGIAAWFGCLVTMMNLFPLGQLDGGHILYAFTGSRPAARRMQYTLMVLTFVALGVLGMYFMGWWVFCGLLLLMVRLTGFNHPAPYDDAAPLSGGSKLLGVLAIMIFVLTFIPIPLELFVP